MIGRKLEGRKGGSEGRREGRERIRGRKGRGKKGGKERQSEEGKKGWKEQG